ncbi:FmdB family zinc ribbon protein [Bacteroidota bacterium]
MPTFAYKCEECGTKYEIFHKTSEKEEDIICPSCISTNAEKLMSAPNIGSMSSGSGYVPDMPPCASGACQSGACGLN